jgi:hypothetical protein
MATMANKDEIGKTKVLVNIYGPLLSFLKRNLDKACLKRDAYLDLALRCESEFLRTEVDAKNSAKAARYISEAIKRLNTTPVSLQISTETADLMKVVCNEKNIPRDAFINRFVLLLTAPEAVLKAAIPAFSEIELMEDVYGEAAEFFWARPNVVDTIQEFVGVSPFWLLRYKLECFREGKDKGGDGYGLYKSVFRPGQFAGLHEDLSVFKISDPNGFNVFMSDKDVEFSELFIGPDPFGVLDAAEDFSAREKQETREKIKRKGKAK